MNVACVQWKWREDGMPASREVLPLMRFFGRRLRIRKGMPEGCGDWIIRKKVPFELIRYA